MGLLLWYTLPYVLGGFGFPLGPDAPVYLWWIRLAGHEGLSAVGTRSAVPALALVAEGTLGLSVVQVVAALEGALAVGVGLSAAALLRGGRRSAAALAGILAGTFAVHLAAGYVANLAFALAFVAAGAALAEGTRRGTIAAAALLGAGGLAHPLFFLLGAGALLLSAGLAWRDDRAEALRVGASVLGGGLIVGIGSLALLAGPGPLEVDTSKDGFLRRAGLTGELRSAYLDRFVHRWARYVQWASIPLAIAGLRDATGSVGRFLRAWGIVTIAGVGLSLATGLAPADRFVTFGFVVPILAALGLVRLWDALAARRTPAIVATGTLAIAMLAGAWIAWDRQEPFLSELEVARVADVNPWAARSTPGTVLVFPVNDDDPAVTFLATRAANVIRAGLPPDRIRDAVVVVPAADGEVPVTRRALTRVTLADADAAIAARAGRHLDALLAPFDRVDLDEARAPRSPWTRVSRGVFLAGVVDGGAGPPVRPLEPSSPAGIAWATVATLALLVAAGYGWARAGIADRVRALALAPAFGMAAIALSAIAMERLGSPLEGESATGLVTSAVAGVSGYLLWLVLERRARTEPPPQIDE